MTRFAETADRGPHNPAANGRLLATVAGRRAWSRHRAAGVLCLTLFAISISVSRGLRREAVRNAFLAEHDTLIELPNRTLFHRWATK